MTNARIRIKVGQVEVEYEGEDNFLKGELLKTLKDVLEIQTKHPVAPTTADNSTIGPTPAVSPSPGAGKIELSTDTIATLIKANTGPELAIAAAANLTFTQNKPVFTRQELIKEMRSSPSHFRDSHPGNMTKYLKSLTKSQDRLRLISKDNDTYALSNKEKQTLEAKLADA